MYSGWKRCKRWEGVYLPGGGDWGLGGGGLCVIQFWLVEFQPCEVFVLLPVCTHLIFFFKLTRRDAWVLLQTLCYRSLLAVLGTYVVTGIEPRSFAHKKSPNPQYLLYLQPYAGVWSCFNLLLCLCVCGTNLSTPLHSMVLIGLGMVLFCFSLYYLSSCYEYRVKTVRQTHHGGIWCENGKHPKFIISFPPQIKKRHWTLKVAEKDPSNV